MYPSSLLYVDIKKKYMSKCECVGVCVCVCVGVCAYIAEHILQNKSKTQRDKGSQKYIQQFGLLKIYEIYLL